MKKKLAALAALGILALGITAAPAHANHLGVVSTNTYCGHATAATSWNVDGSMRTRIDHVQSVTYGTAHVHTYHLQRAENDWWYGTTWVTYAVTSRQCGWA